MTFSEDSTPETLAVLTCPECHQQVELRRGEVHHVWVDDDEPAAGPYCSQGCVETKYRRQARNQAKAERRRRN